MIYTYRIDLFYGNTMQKSSFSKIRAALIIKFNMCKCFVYTNVAKLISLIMCIILSYGARITS